MVVWAGSDTTYREGASYGPGHADSVRTLVAVGDAQSEDVGVPCAVVVADGQSLDEGQGEGVVLGVASWKLGNSHELDEGALAAAGHPCGYVGRTRVVERSSVGGRAWEACLAAVGGAALEVVVAVGLAREAELEGDSREAV